MTRIPEPPNKDIVLIEADKGRLTNQFSTSWKSFFQFLYTGDTGTTWTPLATNLTIVSPTVTLTGSYYRSGQFIDFIINVIPTGGGSSSAVAGSTYIALPFDVLSDGGCFTESGLLAAVGAVDAATNRVYPATWTTVTVPVTITGRVRAN